MDLLYNNNQILLIKIGKFYHYNILIYYYFFRIISLNSKTSPNGTSDSTVKNILDSRRLSTTKSSSLSPTSSTMITNDYQKNLYHYHTNGVTNDTKLSPSTIVNSLTSPNENLLNLPTPNPLDYSLNPSTSSSSIHPSR